MKIIILIINKSLNQIKLVILSFVLLYYIINKLSNILINRMSDNEANDIAKKLINDAPKDDGYISHVAENLMDDISRGTGESDIEFANRIRKKLEIHL